MRSCVLMDVQLDLASWRFSDRLCAAARWTTQAATTPGADSADLAWKPEERGEASLPIRCHASIRRRSILRSRLQLAYFFSSFLECPI